jgi:hypothetical protein
LYCTCFGDLNLDSLIELLVVTANWVLVIFDRGSEQGVDKSGLSQAGFTCVDKK